MAPRGCGCCGTRSKPWSPKKRGSGYLHTKKLQKELADIKKETRTLKARLAVLDQRRDELMKELDG